MMTLLQRHVQFSSEDTLHFLVCVPGPSPDAAVDSDPLQEATSIFFFFSSSLCLFADLSAATSPSQPSYKSNRVFLEGRTAVC